MTVKVGQQDYLGITIDYAREDNLNTFSVETLKDRYLWQDETHAQEAFARASVYGATYQGYTDYDLAQRLYEYASKSWFGFSTPILSNGYLLAVFSIMFLIRVGAFLIIMMRTYGWRVEVEAWVDIGVMLEVTGFLLLTVVSLLVASHSCTL
jgi:hypothetical protein